LQTVTRTEVEINDIFEFAKEKYGYGWNNCGELFRNVLPFVGHRTFYLEDLKGDVNDKNYVDFKRAYEILISFMETNKLDEMYYVGDGN